MHVDIQSILNQLNDEISADEVLQHVASLFARGEAQAEDGEAAA